jgi:hypothetical protein
MERMTFGPLFSGSTLDIGQVIRGLNLQDNPEGMIPSAH